MGPYHVCWVLAVFAVTCGSDEIQNQVPKQTLLSGGSIPMLGMGTFLMTDASQAEAALDLALSMGYRHIDTATAYGSEKAIGRVLKRWLDSSKVKREELFITTKLTPSAMRAEDVPGEIRKSLENLQVDYVDMWLIHHAWGLKRAGSDPETGNLDLSRADLVDNTTDHIAIWKAMENELKAGRTKGLGVANFNESQVERIASIATVPVSNLQVELHLQFQQKELLTFAKKKGINVTAYSPLGNPSLASLYPPTKNYPHLLNTSVVREIAAKHGKTPAQVLLRYSHQRGVVVIPKAVTPSHIRENIDIFDFNLCPTEMSQLAALDKGMLNGKIFAMLESPWIVNHPEYPWPAFRSRLQSR